MEVTRCPLNGRRRQRWVAFLLVFSHFSCCRSVFTIPLLTLHYTLRASTHTPLCISHLLTFFISLHLALVTPYTHYTRTQFVFSSFAILHSLHTTAPSVQDTFGLARTRYAVWLRSDHHRLGYLVKQRLQLF